MAKNIRTGAAAIAWAKNEIKSPSRNWNALCLMFVRKCFNVAAKYPDARTAWANAKKKHKTSNASSIPAGVPVFFDTSSKWDHIVLSIGDGKCISTDALRKGKPDIVSIASLAKNWGPLLGWSEDVNGVTVYKAPIKPTIPAFPKGLAPGKSSPSARTLQKQLKKAGFLAKDASESDNYGPMTRTAVAKFHNKHSQFKAEGVSKDVKIGPKGWNFLFTNY